MARRPQAGALCILMRVAPCGAGFRAFISPHIGALYVVSVFVFDR
jgi:hypothetical protein